MSGPPATWRWHRRCAGRNASTRSPMTQRSVQSPRHGGRGGRLALAPSGTRTSPASADAKPSARPRSTGSRRPAMLPPTSRLGPVVFEDRRDAVETGDVLRETSDGLLRDLDVLM